MVTTTSGMGVMKMGNTVPRAGIKPTSLAFCANVLTITQHRLPDVTTIPTPNCLCSSLPQRSVQSPIVVIGVHFVSHSFDLAGYRTFHDSPIR